VDNIAQSKFNKMATNKHGGLLALYMDF